MHPCTHFHVAWLCAGMLAIRTRACMHTSCWQVVPLSSGAGPAGGIAAGATATGDLTNPAASSMAGVPAAGAVSTVGGLPQAGGATMPVKAEEECVDLLADKCATWGATKCAKPIIRKLCNKMCNSCGYDHAGLFVRIALYEGQQFWDMLGVLGHARGNNNFRT